LSDAVNDRCGFRSLHRDKDEVTYPDEGIEILSNICFVIICPCNQARSNSDFAGKPERQAHLSRKCFVVIL
jgi:hypothetical protein